MLPLACALELLAWHFQLTYPIVLTHVRVARGLMLRGPTEIDFVRSGCEIQMVEVRPSGRRVLAFAARIGDELPDPPQSPPPPSVALLPAPISLTEFYRDLTFHGPRFQGITKLVGVSPRRAEAELKPSCINEWQPNPYARSWRLDPCVVDSAFQLAIYSAIVNAGRALLPKALEAVVILEPLIREPIQLKLELVTEDEKGVTGNFQFTSDSQLLGWITRARASFVDSDLVKPD